MKVVILAGGGGTRLFPLSRVCYPKQFLSVNGEHSLLASTLLRFKSIVSPSDIIVVTNTEYVHYVKDQLALCSMTDAHILTEPVPRNTAPAVALAARYCLDHLGTSSDEVMFITPSDHVILPLEGFLNAAMQASELSRQQKMILFGVKPSKPETGYGYIKAGLACGDAWMVEEFKEKPDRATAEEYVASGNYYWNSGMFAFTIGFLLKELQKYQPSIHDLTKDSFAETSSKFAEMPEISLDYAIAEKSRDVTMLPLNLYWNDIGSWDAIDEVLEKDLDGNALRGDCISLDCKNTLMIGQSRLIAGIGLEDLILVETADVIIAAKKGETQKVKQLVNDLKEKGRREASEHTTIYRPWGSYTVLGQGPNYKMKKIIVNPNQRLSLQLHYHRSEHWIVISGTAKVQIGQSDQMIHENESIFVPQSTLHRLENPGKIPLEIIEIQNGRYLEEDDIVRFDDQYGRI